jgi:hypothetical protein
MKNLLVFLISWVFRESRRNWQSYICKYLNAKYLKIKPDLTSLKFLNGLEYL